MVKFFHAGRIPFAVKMLYTYYMAMLVPIYLRDYGWTNFLYFCDVALFMTLLAVWTENALWASAPLVGILVPQLLWMADFINEAAGRPTGHAIIGVTDYMFKDEILPLTRALSFFHFWLPLFLLYLVWKLGFDRRAFAVWTLLAWFVLCVCYFWMPPPPPPNNDFNIPANINYVFGISNEKPQDWMHPDLWFSFVMGAMPFGIWLPTSWGLSKIFRPAKAAVICPDSRP